MKESDFQSLFTHWMAKNGWQLPGPCVFELKIEKGTSMPFNRVAEHQAKALLDATGSGMYHKINDAPIFHGSKMRFTNPKPFDCFYLKRCSAYVVLWFYHPREKKEMIWIEIGEYIAERMRSARKSLTEERAREIGVVKDL